MVIINKLSMIILKE